MNILNITGSCVRVINWETHNRFQNLYRCPNIHGSSVTIKKSSLFRISVVLPNFNVHNQVTSTRIHFVNAIYDLKSVLPQQNFFWNPSASRTYFFIPSADLHPLSCDKTPANQIKTIRFSGLSLFLKLLIHSQLCVPKIAILEFFEKKLTI